MWGGRSCPPLLIFAQHPAELRSAWTGEGARPHANSPHTNPPHAGDGVVGQTLAQLLKRPEITIERLAPVLRELTPEFFARAFVEMGAPTWPNGFDLDPINLYMELRDAGALTRVAAE